MMWHAWSKWLLLGVTATAIVISAPPDDGRSTESENAKPQQIERAAPQSGAQRQQMFQPGKPAGHVELERLNRKPGMEAAGMVANAFNITSWYVQPPPKPVLPAASLPPPKPGAPPLPFNYFGRYDDPPARIAILAKGDQLYTVSEGDVIDGVYRVERIGEGAVSLIYLPLNISQSISTGGAK